MRRRHQIFTHHKSLVAWQVFLLMICSVFSHIILANENESYISTKGGSFTLSQAGVSAPLCASSQDYPGVIRVLRILQTDINRVTDAQPPLALDSIPAAPEIVLVGTIGKNPFIDRLIQNKKIDPEGIAGHRETFLIQVIDHPFPKVNRALIIAGSEKRGTIYGMFDLSAQIGVSPWYWWADVPVKKKSNIYVLPGRYTQGEPAVQYRGIFINDEAPALSSWVYENFEGFNHKFYEKVFELILRLKGNFLWPAMWGRAFYDDDPQNPRLADEYGVVIGTSHHEPMMRAHDEWRRYGSGPWNYEKNEKKLQEFWREGIRRMNDYESIVTLGMRGDGDMPMSDKANIALLERIVKDQREILAQESGKDIKKIPQVWALYKEVQDYYDKGMQVPDDVTLLFSDDNWGNIRRLPQLHAKPRSGGYGIYYHYDYVGGPRNYKWLNTIQISRVWEQMHLAYEYGVRQIWIVNVGDIKPMEFPINFFLDYAWNPERWPAERLPDYYRLWAEHQFGPEHARETADIIAKYTKYNSRRKPELLSPSTYSLVHYREAERIVEDYNILVKKAEIIYNDLPENYRAAYYQLVLHPVSACANLNELYVTVGKNRLYAEQGRAATNQIAEKARALFEKDAEITHYYNKIMAGGKWNHMMDQTHIGYTYWQQPDKNSMPKVKTIKLANTAKMGVAVQGSKKWWPKSKKELVLPEFDPYNKQKYYIDLFNQGKTPFLFSVKAEKSCLKIEPPHGQVDLEKRIWVSIDWEKVPSGKLKVPIIITQSKGNQGIVYAPVYNPGSPKPETIKGFVESNGYVSLEAPHYTHKVENDSIFWQCIPNLGRTLSSLTPFPITAPDQTPGGSSPCLEYSIYFFSSGEVTVNAYLSPTLNFPNGQGLDYGISFDQKQPQIINMHAGFSFQDWEESVRTNTNIQVSTHHLDRTGQHILKFWMVDPGVVLQKLVIDTGGLKSSYLGPPESYYQQNNQ